MTALRPRPLFCPIWHLHPGLDVAGDVCAGIFEHGGHRLALGIPPDWNGPLPSDEEWGIEWSKFYFGLELAQAFARTLNRRYLAAWQLLVDSWIDQDPKRFRTSDVTARRLLSWLFAWDRFAQANPSPGISRAFSERLLASFADQLAKSATTSRPNATTGPSSCWRSI